MKDKSKPKKILMAIKRVVDRTAGSFIEGIIDTHFLASYCRKREIDGWYRLKYKFGADDIPRFFHDIGTLAAIFAYPMGCNYLQTKLTGDSNGFLTAASFCVPIATNLLNLLYEKRQREEAQQEINDLQDNFTNPSSIKNN
jgi:hypothetical protein